MAKENFREALRRLLQHEGGYSNHPSDPGGPTKFGITIHDYRRYINARAGAADVRAMTLEQARSIYRDNYWAALNCDALPAGVDYAVFDYGVNSGIGRSGKVLRRLVGLPAHTHAVTVEVIAAVSQRDSRAIIGAICDERLRFLRSLKTWQVFGNGWSRRVREVRAAALEMAAARAVTPDRESAGAGATHGVGGRGQVPAPNGARRILHTGVPLSALGIFAAAHDWVAAHPVATGLAVAVLASGIWVALRALANRRARRQETPMPDTPVVPAIA
jgi:lysozyme family protein